MLTGLLLLRLVPVLGVGVGATFAVSVRFTEKHQVAIERPHRVTKRLLKGIGSCKVRGTRRASLFLVSVSRTTRRFTST